MINEVRGHNPMASGSQYLHDSARAAGWLPNDMRQCFDAQKRMHGNIRRLV
jgi:hypothetical protein